MNRPTVAPNSSIQLELSQQEVNAIIAALFRDEQDRNLPLPTQQEAAELACRLVDEHTPESGY